MDKTARRIVTTLVTLAILGGLTYIYWSRHHATAASGMAGVPGMAGAPGARSAGPAGGGRPGGPGAFSQMPVAVITAEAAMKPWAVEVEALGTTRANEAVDITTKTANLVTAIRFEEGQAVKRGQVLVELDSAQARADLAAAEAALGESRSTFRRSRDLVAQNALSQSQLEQIEAALKANEARAASAAARVADTVIRAPFDGRAGLRRVSVGSLISPGTVITTVDDTSVMKIDFDVPETFLTVLAPGLEVVATSVAYPGRSFTGEVASIDSRVDPVSRAVTVRARLPNPEGLLKQGMFVNVRVAREAKPTVVVPEQAIVPERGKVFVFTVADDVATKREVTTARRRPGETEIVAGLAAGERVVVEGTQKVRDGGPVSEAPAR
ncbi:MAG: efflux RND transporter periplasmic adaptor subunit [Steroidobacteraceae bacterium]|nr:efflux RND transporter periplasmic adaptor subunit [Steroidobacteraceae bacterium]